MTTENGTKKGGIAEEAASRAPRADVLFELGEKYFTPGVLVAVPMRELLLGLHRHARGDWGNLELFDWQQNELALQNGSRLFSAYRGGNGVKFWIITESDRSCTTVLLPEEY